MSSERRLTRQPDAAPCQVIVAEFVFGVRRCGENALYTTRWNGQDYRICDEHASVGGTQ